nr:MerR family transcriptional regulator [Frankia sp. AiPa1]
MTIGDFARHGRVSVRMLRHYDRIGLLRPARIDAATGYRLYTAAQLARLHRIVALKELGFGLAQVQDILDEQVSAEQLRGMLRLRQAELRVRIAADTARLAQVRARLQTIESEGTMPTTDVTIKDLPAVRVAELAGTARAMDPLSIGPVVRALFDQLATALTAAAVTPAGPAIAYYREAGGHETVAVHAAFPVNVPLPADGASSADATVPAVTTAAALAGVRIVDLPAVPAAAAIVHEGSMDDCMPTYQALARWIEQAGYRDAGPGREISLACPADPAGWITEIQQPVTRR